MAALALLWRLPSYFDPPWVNDEGTYFAVAQAMAHGFRLYRDVWENKPPAIYLLYSAVYRLFGPSLIGVRLLAALAVVLSIGLTWAVAFHWLRDRRSALFAAALTGLLFGVPFLEGTTANAEVFLAAASAAGVWLVLVRERPVAGGALLGIAILFKVVGVFDAAAIGVWLFLHRRDLVARFAAGVTPVVALAVVLAAWAGILPDMVRDALLYDFGYVGHANGGGTPWLVPAKLLLLAAVSVLTRNRPFPALWLAWALAGAVISNRVFGHYFLQAVVPFSMCVCLLAPRATASRRALPALFLAAVALAGLTGAAGAVLAARGGDSILARRLQYYPNFIRYALGTRTYAWYRDQIDDHVTRNLQVAALVRDGPRGGRLLVWGNTPWIYPLSGRLPATPYTSALRSPEVPGETAALRAAIVWGRASEVVVIAPAMPPLGSAAQALRDSYRATVAVDNAALFLRGTTFPFRSR